MVNFSRGILLNIVGLMAVIFMSSCQKMGDNDYSEFINLPDNGWVYGDTLSFQPVLADSAAMGELVLALRHTNDYIYSNIFLEITITDSITTTRDTLTISLADDIGRWLGRGIGTDYQVSDTVSSKITLRRPISIDVRHVMRTDILKDIKQLGISFKQI